MVIIKATKEDAEEILKLQKLVYLSEAELYNDYCIPPLTQTLEEIIKDFGTHTFLKAIENNSIIGAVKGCQENETCYIGRIIVAEEFQNRGIGTKLLNQIEEVFKPIKRYELFTGKKSERNLYLYKKLGYKVFREEDLNEKTSLVFLEKVTSKF